MSSTRRLGDAGERLALSRLEALGYELVESNWRCRGGEIDLIMRDAGTLVFVEVRTRRGRASGSPEESVTPAKQARLIALGEQWLAEQYPDTEPPDCRIDVVGVHLSTSGKLLAVNHIPGAVGF
ncbi:MAG: YraN family protein [Chloroflexota bacterium]|nr:YraN family protein [Chloroflexota bacterium]